MNDKAVEVLVQKSTTATSSLFVDANKVDCEIIENGTLITSLSTLGIAPEELWAVTTKFDLAVITAPRPARELFRVLALLHNIVTDTILIAPYDVEDAFETRAEATEIFCGAYPWTRRMIEGGVVELKRGTAVTIQERQPDGSWKDGERIVSHDSPPVAVVTSPVWLGPKEWKGTVFSKDDVAVSMPKRTRKKVVSLSVFGPPQPNDPLWKDMPKFVVTYVLAHHALFPGYELRIHHDEHLYREHAGDVLHGLARRGLVKLVYVPSRPGQGKCERMLHRLMPVWDADVDFVFCRDVDSLPTWRDREICEEFMTSGCTLGTVHDNPAHVGIMGGLCHVDVKKFRKAIEYKTFDEFLPEYTDEEFAVHGADQNYLNYIAHKMPSILEHSLVDIRSENGERILRKPTWTRSDFRTKIAMIDGVVVGSDMLINYLGASGYRVDEARAFYDMRSPIVNDVREAEKMAAIP